MMLAKFTDNPIRSKNISSTIEYILNEGAVSRAQIASQLHINKPSVSEIVKLLLDDQIIEEIGMGSSSHLGGRKPILVRMKEDWALFLCVDIGYNYLKFYLTYANGTNVLYEVIEQHPIKRDTIINELIDYILHIKEKCPITNVGIAAITLSIHGSVSEEKIVFTPYYDLVAMPIKESLEKEFKVPVLYCNEANLSSIANQALCKDQHNIISISIHSGVGSGIIMNDVLYHGNKHFGGEIGHMILIPEGRECPCGNHGCLETYCSEKAILEDFQNKLQKQFILQDIRNLYDKKDAYTIETIHKISNYLAIGVNNLLVTFNPQIIYFNCALFQMFPELITFIKKNLHCLFVSSTTLEISPIADTSILIGGILYGMKKIFHIQNIQIANLHFK